MKNSHDTEWLEQNNWGKWGPHDEVGILNEVTSQSVVEAVKLIKQGKVYDLETVRFKGMPVWPGHAGWDLLVYASPSGRRNMYESEIDPSYNWYAKDCLSDYSAVGTPPATTSAILRQQDESSSL